MPQPLHEAVAQLCPERGLRPVGNPPGGYSPIAHPAPVFDPTSFERDT
jgi:hypothetical protein